jgi:ADP-ribosylglycohydrolase
MVGAIIGDIIGSRHEFDATKTKEFDLKHLRCACTDDSILTIAVAKHLLDGDPLVPLFHAMVERFPGAGWGGRFLRWATERQTSPYYSYGNGSAMRVSAVGFAFDTLDETLDAARKTAEVTHDHPEGIKGAQATAAAIFLARSGASKNLIRAEVTDRFDYNLSRTVDEVRPRYSFDESCQGTVPQAIIAFLDSTSFEDTLRNAISLGGDADTLAAIAGPIAQAFYDDSSTGVPPDLREFAKFRIAEDLWEVVERFERRFMAADSPQ